MTNWYVTTVTKSKLEPTGYYRVTVIFKLRDPDPPENSISEDTRRFYSRNESAQSQTAAHADTLNRQHGLLKELDS